jgi:hypothetical protein
MPQANHEPSAGRAPARNHSRCPRALLAPAVPASPIARGADESFRRHRIAKQRRPRRVKQACRSAIRYFGRHGCCQFEMVSGLWQNILTRESPPPACAPMRVAESGNDPQRCKQFPGPCHPERWFCFALREAKSESKDLFHADAVRSTNGNFHLRLVYDRILPVVGMPRRVVGEDEMKKILDFAERFAKRIVPLRSG